jgi:hypothetical protein
MVPPQVMKWTPAWTAGSKVPARSSMHWASKVLEAVAPPTLRQGTP